MGSSWRYRHDTITPYSIGCEPVKNVRVKVFFKGSLVHFSRARSYINFSRARMEVNRKTNQPIWPLPPFHSIFQTQASPHYPQPNPIHYWHSTNILTNDTIAVKLDCRTVTSVVECSECFNCPMHICTIVRRYDRRKQIYYLFFKQ